MSEITFERCAFCVLFITFIVLIFFDKFYNKTTENMPSYLAPPGMTLGTHADNTSVWNNIPNNKPLMIDKLHNDKNQYNFREHYQCKPRKYKSFIENKMEQEEELNTDSESDNDSDYAVDNYYNFYAKRDRKKKKEKKEYYPEPNSDRPDLNNCIPCKPCKPCKC